MSERQVLQKGLESLADQAWAVNNILQTLCAALPCDEAAAVPVRSVVDYVVSLSKPLASAITELADTVPMDGGAKTSGRLDTVQSYAIDLLYAAKWVAHPPVNATPELLATYQQKLVAAVVAFEAGMPTVNGVIVEHPSSMGA